MSLIQATENYFSMFYEVSSAKTSLLCKTGAFLKICSLFTVVIPLVFGVIYLSLKGRVTQAPPSSATKVLSLTILHGAVTPPTLSLPTSSATELIPLQSIVESQEALEKAISLIEKELPALDECNCFCRSNRSLHDAIYRYHFFLRALLGERNLFQSIGPSQLKELQDDIKTRGLKWEAIKLAMREAQQEVIKNAPHLLTKPLTWLHGTSQAMLPGVINMVLPGERPSLKPTGKLLAEGFAPLTGEVGFGVASRGGINNSALSGVDPTYYEGALSYALAQENAFARELVLKDILDIKADAFLSLPLLKILVLRLFLTEGPGEEKEQVISHLQLLANAYLQQPLKKNWREGLKVLGQKESALIRGLPLSFLMRGSVVFLKMGEPTVGIITEIRDENALVYVGSSHPQWALLSQLTEVDLGHVPSSSKVEPSKETEEFFAQQMMTPREKLEELVALLESDRRPQPFMMTIRSKAMLREHVPLVWGSYTASCFRRAGSDIRGELALKGAQELGKDIQVLFCPQKDVIRIRSWLEEKLQPSRIRVDVLSFEASYYILGATAFEVTDGGLLMYDSLED